MYLSMYARMGDWVVGGKAGPIRRGGVCVWWAISQSAIDASPSGMAGKLLATGTGDGSRTM
jgi:hypothetical protein